MFTPLLWASHGINESNILSLLEAIKDLAEAKTILRFRAMFILSPPGG
jgi:hypothetical protein